MKYYHPMGKEPILDILKKDNSGFVSCAYIWPPFYRIDGFNGRFPGEKTVYHLGKNISWNEMSNRTGLRIEELAAPIEYYYLGGTWMDNYKHQYRLLKRNLRYNEFISSEDYFPIQIIDEIIALFKLAGSNTLKHCRLEETRRDFSIDELSFDDKLYICSDWPSTLTNETGSLAVTRYFDTAYLLVMSKMNDLEELLSQISLEYKMCDSKSTLTAWETM